jgi:hypothetical protein
MSQTVWRPLPKDFWTSSDKDPNNLYKKAFMFQLTEVDANHSNCSTDASATTTCTTKKPRGLKIKTDYVITSAITNEYVNADMTSASINMTGGKFMDSYVWQLLK